MSKKKSKQLPITEVQLTPEQIALRQIRGERIGHEAQ